MYKDLADWGSVGGGRHIWPPSAASVSRSANAVMFVMVLALSVVGGGFEDGPFFVVCGGISNVRVGFAGRSLERLLSSGASGSRLGAMSLRGRDIARPMVGSRPSLFRSVGGEGCLSKAGLENLKSGGDMWNIWVILD